MAIGSVDLNLTTNPAPIMSPLQAANQVMSLGAALQERQLRQNQIQATQLENQARTQQLGADKATADALAKYTTRDANGNVNVDYDSAISDVAKNGFGKAAEQIYTLKRANQTQQIQQQNAQLDLHDKQLQQFASLLGPIYTAQNDPKTTPTVTIDTGATVVNPALQQMYTTARNQAIQRGLITPDHAPTQYDPAFVKQAFLGVQAGQTQVAEARENALFAQNAIKAADEHKAAATKSAQDQVNLVAQLMGGATNQPQWDFARREAQNAGVPDELLATISPTFSTTEAKRVSELGITAPQRSEETHRQAEETARNRQLKVAEDREADYHQRIQDLEDKTNPQKQKALVADLANQVLTDSLKGGGKGIDDAVKNVMTPSFYVNDPVDDHRGEIAAQLNSWKAQGLKPDQIAAQTAAARGRANRTIAWRTSGQVEGGTPQQTPTPAPNTTPAPKAGATTAPQGTTPTTGTPAKPQQAPAGPATFRIPDDYPDKTLAGKYVTFRIPDDYPDKTLAGKYVTFKDRATAVDTLKKYGYEITQ